MGRKKAITQKLQKKDRRQNPQNAFGLDHAFAQAQEP
jgi:predicted amidophosphoribosyltransferase